MPYFPGTSPIKHIQPPEMIPVQGGIFAMGSHLLHQKWGDCKPRLVQVDSFSIAPTCVTLGLQKQVMEGIDDKAPDNHPAILSFDDNVAFCQKLSLLTGCSYGIGREGEWEYAARDRIDNVREFMERHPELGLKGIADLRDWLVEGNGWLENFVVLSRGEELTLQSRLMSDPGDTEFVRILEAASLISCWTVFAGESDLNRDAFYFNQEARGPVRYGKPNQKGVWDMTGGMWEWCADVYRKDAYKHLPQGNPFNNPKGPDDRRSRVQRGGSWYSGGHGDLRVACRLDGDSCGFNDLFGARLFGSAQDSHK